MVDLNLAMEIANGNAIGMGIKAVARIMENLTKEGKMEATTEARIVVEGIHTNFASLISGKDTMSLSAEKLHEKEKGTTTMAMEMEMEMATDLDRLDQSLISRILLNLSLTLRTQ